MIKYQNLFKAYWGSIRGLGGLYFEVRRNEQYLRCVTPLLDSHLNINAPIFSFSVVFADKRAESSHIKTSAVIQKLLLRVALRLCVCVLRS